MEFSCIFNGVVWIAIAFGVLGNLFKWWNFNLPDIVIFCACLICSMNFFNDLRREK